MISPIQRSTPTRAALAGLGLLLAGCATLPPSPAPDTRLELPAQFGDARDGLRAAPSDRLSDQWWGTFDDGRLTELIERALENNLDLQITAARVDAALAQARIAGADLSPQVGASLNSRRSKQNFIGLPIPGAQDRVLSTTSTNHGLSLNVSWEPDLWGRLRAGQAAALGDARAVALELDGARISLAGQIAKLYFAQLEAAQLVALDEQTLASREITSEQIGLRYDRGLASPLEVRLARTQIATVEASLITNRQRADSLSRQLEVLLGEYPSGDLLHEGSLPAPPEAVPDGVPSELLLRRPDLAIARERALAAAQRVRQSEAALYPSFSLTASGGTSSNELDDLLDGDFSVWSLATSLLQPIFQGGRLRAAVDANRAAHEQTLLAWVQQSLVAFSEVETQLAAERFTQERLDALERALTEAREAERLALDRYLAGLAGYLDLLDAQRQAFGAEAQHLAARRARLDARIDLILALGGGFEDTTRDRGTDEGSEDPPAQTPPSNGPTPALDAPEPKHG